MLCAIIIREMQEYIKTTKFLLGLFLTVTLVVIVTRVNIIEYTARKQVYLDSISKPGTEVVYREPQPLSIFAQGIDLSSGEKKTLFIYDMLREDMGNKGEDPFLLADFGFGTVDFLFIIKVIISLLVIFFAYDIVSGEKERGTLRLSLSNSLPRWELMFGKMLSGLGVVTMFLAISMLVAALIVAFQPDVHFSAGDWIRVLLIFGVSLMYLSVFFTLSAMVSIIANSAAVTLLILVQLWVMIAIVIPGSGALMAQTAHPQDIPNLQETDKQTQAVVEEYREKEDALGAIDTNEKAYTRDSLRNESNEALVSRVYMPRTNMLTREAEKIQNAIMISPAGLYDQIVLRLARTDFKEYDLFQKSVLVYWKTSSTDRLNWIFNNLSSPWKKQDVKELVFSYRSEGIQESLFRMGWNLFILFAWSLVFFVAAHAAFLRKDVR